MRNRPRRSCLYLPGANPRALAKAPGLAADMLIFDLEDAVAPDAKGDARQLVAEALRAGGFGKHEIVVRVNGLGSEWAKADLATVSSLRPDGVLWPKVSSAEDVIAADRAMIESGTDEQTVLWVMIETPLALLNIQAIAAASQRTRLVGLIMGTNDLAKELGAQPTVDRAAFQTGFGLTIAAARAFGLAVIDGVFNDTQDVAGLEAETLQGRVLGFDGKTLIHPTQLEQANRIFAPSEQELARSRAIIDAFSLPENAGKGVIKVDGQMTELLHLEQANRLVAMQAAIDTE